MRGTPAAPLAAALVLVLSPFLPAKDVLPQLPASTVLAIGIRDVDQMQKDVAASNLQKAWDSAEMTGLRTKLLKSRDDLKASVQQETGVDLGQLLDLFHGGVAFCVSHADTSKGFSNLELDVALVAEVPADRQEQARTMMERMLTHLPSDAKKSTFDFRGHKVWSSTWEEKGANTDSGDTSDGDTPTASPTPASGTPKLHVLQYCFTDKLLIVSEGPEDPIKPLVTDMEGGERSTLSGLDPFRRLGGMKEGSTLVDVYANWEPFTSALSKSTDEDQKRVGTVLETSGISAAGPLYGSFRLGETGGESRIAILTPEKPQGLLRSVVGGEFLTLKSARAVPSDAELYESFSLDAGVLLDEIRAVVQKVNPEGLKVFDAELKGLGTPYNLDVEGDVIRSVQGEHMVFRKHAPTTTAPGADAAKAPESIVVALGLKSGSKASEQLNKAMTTMAAPPFNFPMEQAPTAQGIPVWKPKPDGDEKPLINPGIALPPAQLIVGTNIEDVQQTLRGLAGSGGATLDSTDAFRKTASTLEKDGLFFFALTMPSAFASVPDAIKLALRQMGDEELPITEEDIPGGDWVKKYFGVSTRTGHYKNGLLTFESRQYAPGRN